ncbi:MAG: EAL domain-containing protein [Gammaproteobacteria bacterium]
MIAREKIKNANIMLMDNDLVNILALKNILHNHEFSSVNTLKPIDNERYFDPQRLPDLIIINIDTTVGENLGVLNNIHRELASRPAPILIVTREVESPMAKKALQTGAKEILAWPFTQTEVISRVNVLLENYYLSLAVAHGGGNTGEGDYSNPHLQIVELTRQLEKNTRHEQESRYLTGRDALTGLANTASLVDYLRSVLCNIIQDDRIVALLIFSLENFGDITKSLGYDKGDLILQLAAERITDSVDKLSLGASAEECCVARYSGGKFVVVLNDLESETRAVSIAHRILSAMSAPFELPDIVLDVGTQVGVSLAPRFTKEATEMVRQGEVALHTAKMSSQPLIVYEKDIDNYDPRRLSLMAELRKAINNDELYLVYQPKININTGVVSGVEALLRWNHDKLGLIPPNEFIPMAEQSSVIKPLTVWVLNTAMRQATAFAKSGLDIAIAVNISACSLRDDSLVGYTRMLLQKNNIEAERLILEITESAMMQDPVLGLSLLNQLSNLGVQISIDDYGTGYSSLAYLKRFPVSEMKIDRTFIKDMSVDEDDKLIVGTTIDMGHNFGLRVIAEGVEDGDTANLLKQMGCDQVQGYYYAKPMPVDDLYNWMTVDNKVAWTLS